jgi:hypothetical protein
MTFNRLAIVLADKRLQSAFRFKAPWEYPRVANSEVIRTGRPHTDESMSPKRL